jgi:hypothetical protein
MLTRATNGRQGIEYCGKLFAGINEMSDKTIFATTEMMKMRLTQTESNLIHAKKMMPIIL